MKTHLDLEDFYKNFYKNNHILEIIKPATNDIIFKIVLKENPEIVKLLIKELANLDLEKISYIDTNQIDNIHLKYQQADIVIENENNDTLINIEMDNYKTKIKNLLYAFNLIKSSLNKGTNYNKAKKVFQITFDNYKYFKNSKRSLEKIYFMNEDKQIENTYLRKVRICLPNIKKFCYNKNIKELTDVERISLMLVEEDIENLFKLADGKEEYINMAATIIKANTNDDILGKAEALEIEYNLMKKEFYHEGEISGIKKGKKEGKKEGFSESLIMVAKNMLKKGVAISLISEYTGLSENKMSKIAI